MRKNMKKIVSIILTMLVIFSLGTSTFATAGIVSSTITPTLGNPDMEGQVNEVLGSINVICLAIAFGMLIYLGIKYTMASANEKADVKSASIRYIIGLIVIIACVNLFTIMIAAAGDITAAT